MGEVLMSKDLGLKKIGSFVPGRHFFKFSDTEEKGRVSYLFDKDLCGEISVDKFREEMSVIGCDLIEDRNRYTQGKNFYDCRNWAFDTVGLPQYTFRESFEKADMLSLYDFSDIRYTSSPAEGAVVMYHDAYSVMHWGVVDSVQEGIHIHSKWGPSDVFSHKLENVPFIFGNKIMFFEKK